MSGVFISYRRSDTQPYARMLGAALASHFGAEQVFRDVDTMAPGVEFPRAIAEAVAGCDALVALIGGGWLAAQREGVRRLDDPGDYVRLEIAAALERRIVVVPVLIEDTPMPGREDLPEALAALADRNALRLTDDAWDAGVARLIEALERVVGPAAAPTPVSSSGDTITADIRGPMSGQVAVGKDIVQTQAPAGPASEVGPAERAELDRAVAALRARIRSEASAAALRPALDRVEELEEAVQDPGADIADALAYVQGWFAQNLPALADAVAAVAGHPVVDRLVRAAGVSR